MYIKKSNGYQIDLYYYSSDEVMPREKENECKGYEEEEEEEKDAKDYSLFAMVDCQETREEEAVMQRQKQFTWFRIYLCLHPQKRREETFYYFFKGVIYR